MQSLVSGVSPLQFKVGPEGRGQRADRWLTAQLTQAGLTPSRSEVSRWFEAGAVTWRGEVCDASRKMKEGEELVVTAPRPVLSSALPDGDVVYDTVHVDDDVVVVNKPRGLVVHPAKGHPDGTLVNGLLASGYFDLELLGDVDESGFLRPGVVHRIDKDTSGLLVIARTAAAREHLKAQFFAHTTERVYEALALGKVQDQTLSSMHGRHPVDRKRFSTNVREGKHAITHVHLLAQYGPVAHAEFRLETGRTHQIRVHTAELLRAPLLGDLLYGKAPKDPMLKALSELLHGQALHARVLGFVQPSTGKKLRFEVPPPQVFTDVLQKIQRLADEA